MFTGSSVMTLADLMMPTKSAPRSQRLPPAGGGPGTLPSPPERRSWASDNRKPSAPDGSIERKYIDNLQQQVYYLELELKHMRASGGAGVSKTTGAELDATLRGGEGGTVSELRERITVLEQRAERLREDALRAMIGEKREKEEMSRLAEKLAQQTQQSASEREELTMEAVGYQRELEKTYLSEKTLRMELGDMKQLLSSRETFVQDFDSKFRLLESRMAEKELELATALQQLESQRKEISDSHAAQTGLREKVDAHRRKEGLLGEQRKEAVEEAKNAIIELRQLQIKHEHEQQVRLAAEKNEAGVVRENQELVTLVKDITSTADLLSLENEKLKKEADQNKMVAVVGKYMIRKMSEKMIRAREGLRRVTER